MERIEKAVSTAKYNEAVIVTIEDEREAGNADENGRHSSARSEEVVLVATLNKADGGIGWERATESIEADGAPDVGILRHFRTKRWVLPMLNDSKRNCLYRVAIRNACRKVVATRRRAAAYHDSVIRVLDIGSGTGLLAMMAHKYMTDELADKGLSEVYTVKVTSLEMASAMARIARATLAENKFTVDQVIVEERHSTNFFLEDDTQKFDMCTSELLESGLLGEGWVPALRDAWLRLLRKDAVVVPQGARVFAQLIDSKERVGCYVGPTRKMPPPGKELRLTTVSDGDGDFLCGVGNSTVQVSLHASSLFGDDDEGPSAQLLSKPVQVAELDVSSLGNIPDAFGNRTTTVVIPTCDGRCHGFLVWWELDLWKGEFDGIGSTTTYTTEPNIQEKKSYGAAATDESEHWQDHWHQCLHVLPRPFPVTQDEPINVVGITTDTKLSFEFSDITPRLSKLAKKDSRQNLISPQRCLVLNDERRIQTLRESIAFTLSQQKPEETVVLDISDFGLCGMLAALEGARHVVSMESSAATAMLAATVAQVGNGLPKNPKENTFQVLHCHPSDLEMDRPATVVVAEPYFNILEGYPLQESLNMFYLVRALKRRGLITDDARVIPSHTTILGQGIRECKVTRAFSTLGGDSQPQEIEGFTHRHVYEWGVEQTYLRHSIPLPMWQYDDVQYTTNDFVLGKLEHQSSSTSGIGSWNECPVEQGDDRVDCAAVALWMEHSYPIGNTSKVISTKSRCHLQLLRLLDPSKRPSMPKYLRCRLTFENVGDQDDHMVEVETIE